MLKRFFSVIMSTILIALLVVSMVGCGGPEEAEAKRLVKDLVSRSYELNEIYFGKKGLAYRDTGNPDAIYMPVLETEKYVLKKDLVKATREVFCKDYSDQIISMAFNGVQSEINQNSVQSRFMVMSDDEWLYVNKNYEYPVEHLTEYDFDTITITYTSSSFIEATIEGTLMTDKGIKDVLVEVSLICEDDQWRLQSGTY